MKPARFLLKLLLFTIALSSLAQAFYDPGQGRWPSRDPAGESGGVDLYGFVSNGSLNAIDRLGLVEIDFFPSDAALAPFEIKPDGDSSTAYPNKIGSSGILMQEF